MASELQSLRNVWLVAIAALCYARFVSRLRPKGLPRLLSLLPIFSLFTLLPLSLSSVHLCGPTAFFLTWLANFKLLLLSFGLGPLSSPDLPFLHFLLIASLPINPPPNPDPSPKSPPSPQKTPRNGDPSPPISDPSPQSPPILPRSAVLALQALAFAAVVSCYPHRRRLHGSVILALYCCHMYLGLGLILGLTAGLARAFAALETEPQFREPYLATSLQDFWGRRWNLMVPCILRAAVYCPIRRAWAAFFGLRGAAAAGTLAAFLVSGLMHELVWFYFTRAPPTWEVTWFFVLNGACTAAEVAAKKRLAAAGGGGWRLPAAVSRTLTIGFVAVTGWWFFFPQMMRHGVDLRAIDEYFIFWNFLKETFASFSSFRFWQ